MTLGGFLVLLAEMALPLPAVGQIVGGVCPPLPQIETQNAQPKTRSYVVNAFADEAAGPMSQINCPETGPIHILYSDGTEIIRGFQPALNAYDGYQVGFSSIKVANDKQTVGWAEDSRLEIQSWTPLVLSIYRKGKIIFRKEVGGAIWYWEFIDSGNRIGVISGPSHGNWCGAYQLFDVETGKILSFFQRDRGDDPCVRPSDPHWVRQLEKNSTN